MIRLHAGRLLLVCDRIDRTWHARVILGPKAEHQVEVDTGTNSLHDALLKAEAVFQAASVMCWDCIQWEMSTQRCDLLLPESKRSGGRYAVSCDFFQRALPAAD
jgi:hypothetical protein